MARLSPLPVDDILPELVSAVERHPAVVLQAPPGAGKTTRVPLALLDSPFFRDRSIIVLEPRRLAAVNAARWMSSLLGEDVGETVGYRIRFESRVSKRTRIEVVTEGIMVRRLQADPLLQNVGLVIFDEFHERSLDADIALALCRDVMKGVREDLRVLIMSATLEGDLLAGRLGAPLVVSEGKAWPVETRYLEREPDRDPAVAAASTVRSALREGEGDILVFLPGGAEIRRCRSLLTEEAAGRLLVLPLYGDLPYREQERAILPSTTRKVVLATNIAETSLTIEGIRIVVDTGLARLIRYHPSSGLSRMSTGRISAASADQRRGRAGRLGPGICYRLWTRHAQENLLPQTPPEILSSDLAPLALQLAGWGVRDAGELPWIDPPPPAALDEGRKLLVRLGALDDRGMPTARGREMLGFPVHPRLGALLLRAVEIGEAGAGCDLAALLSERDIVKGRDASRWIGCNDLLDRVETLERWRLRGEAPPEIDPNACRAVHRISSLLRRMLDPGAPGAHPESEEVAILAAHAYPDRIGRRRGPGSDRYVLAGGRGVLLSPQTSVRDSEFIVAAVVEGEEGGEGLVRQAAAISPETIRKEFPRLLTQERSVVWDEPEGRVAGREEERLGAISLSARQFRPADDEALPILVELLSRKDRLSLLGWSRDAEQFRRRVIFLSRSLPEEGLPDFTDEGLAETVEEWLVPYLSGLRTRNQLAGFDPLPALRSALTHHQLRIVEDEAPPRLRVPSGSSITLDYSSGEPVLAVKLQELFGLGETPAVARKRVPVVLHLLSPAGRPVQVTRDLRSFWEKVYPEVRKELRGRYPRHPWPDDPWNAPPTRHTKRR
jgi:ATP-dependent helicase HrpB